MITFTLNVCFPPSHTHNTHIHTLSPERELFGILFFRIKLQILCRLSHSRPFSASLWFVRPIYILSFVHSNPIGVRTTAKTSYMAYQLTLVWSNFVKRDSSDGFLFFSFFHLTSYMKSHSLHFDFWNLSRAVRCTLHAVSCLCNVYVCMRFTKLTLCATHFMHV